MIFSYYKSARIKLLLSKINLRNKKTLLIGLETIGLEVIKLEVIGLEMIVNHPNQTNSH